MFLIKPIGFLSGVGVIVACFFPWVIIESRDIVVSGFASTGTSFGKPGVLHVAFTIIYLILLAIPRVWSRRVNMLIGAFNLAWAVRNFILISTCSGGECPLKQPALYLLLSLSVLMMVVLVSAPQPK
jgi:hypothetical protein